MLALGKETGPEIAAAAEVVELAHAEVLWAGSKGPSLMGFHGQTTAHFPDEGRTCQIGDGSGFGDILWACRSSGIFAVPPT